MDEKSTSGPEQADRTSTEAGASGDERSTPEATAGDTATPRSTAPDPVSGDGATTDGRPSADRPAGATTDPPDPAGTATAATGPATTGPATTGDAAASPPTDGAPVTGAPVTGAPATGAADTGGSATGGPDEGPTTTVPTADPGAGPGADADTTVTVTRPPGGPESDATVTVPRPTGGPDSDTTVTVTRPPAGPDRDATVSVPLGSVPAPTQVGAGAGWPGPPQGDPQGAGAWPAGTWGSGAWGPPGQSPPLPGSPGATSVWPGAPEPIRRRNGKPLAILGVVLLLAVVAGVVFLVLPPGATTAVGNVADEARTWNGTTYRGTVRGPGASPVTIDMTVDASGDKSGTLTRAGGGRAEFAEIGGVPALRGNAAWWAGAPQGADKGRRFAGIWLRNPAPEIPWLAPLPLLAPTALADDLAPANGPDYEDAGDQPVDGVAGRVVAAGDQRVVLTDDRDARLLSVVPVESSDPVGLRVGAAQPAELSAIGAARSSLGSARDYTAVLYDPSDVAARILPAPECASPTCSVAARLTNTAALEARGVATLSLDGRQLARVPFTLGPKATRDVSTNFPNPLLGTGIARITVTYTVRVTAN